MDAALLKGLQTSIPGRYACALFDVASEQKESLMILEKLKDFDRACISDPHIKRMLPFLSVSELESFINDIASTLKWPKYLIHFFRIVHERRRLNALRQMIDVFEQCCHHEYNTMNAHISMPIMPTPVQKKNIQAHVTSLFGKTVNFTYESIPDLLGGVVVQADNMRIDASLKNQLSALQKTLADMNTKGAA